MMANLKGDPQSRALARRVIRELQIQAPDEIDVELIAAHFGLLVERRVLRYEEGRLVRRGRTGIIVVSEQAHTSKKWRFVVAHELGHFFRHQKLDQFDLCTNAELAGWYTTSGREAEANEFAGELLMPDTLFRKFCDRNRPSLHDVRELAEKFQTSLTATAIRYVQLTDEPCAVALSRAGTVQWVVKNDEFQVYIWRGTQLDRGSYAGDLFAGAHVEDRLQSVDAESWSDRPCEDVDLHEHSQWVARDSVLTFFWHRSQ